MTYLPLINEEGYLVGSVEIKTCEPSEELHCTCKPCPCCLCCSPRKWMMQGRRRQGEHEVANIYELIIAGQFDK